MYLATIFDILINHAWRRQKSLDSSPGYATAKHMLAKVEALVPDNPRVKPYYGWCLDWLIARVEIDEAKALTQSQPSTETIDKP
jgi:hypothetical protein